MGRDPHILMTRKYTKERLEAAAKLSYSKRQLCEALGVSQVLRVRAISRGPASTGRRPLLTGWKDLGGDSWPASEQTGCIGAFGKPPSLKQRLTPRRDGELFTVRGRQGMHPVLTRRICGIDTHRTDCGDGGSSPPDGSKCGFT